MDDYIMENNKIQPIGTIEGVRLFFDPLRKTDSFIVLEKSAEMKNGFLLKDDEIIFESDSNLKWDEISSIIAGFSSFNFFNKIKDKINEEK